MLLFRVLRSYQWVKNLLLFVPFILAYPESDITYLLELCLAFVAFSFCASANYIVNDITDIESDRRHPLKKTRPIAAGEISIKQGIMIAFALLAIGFSIAYFLSTEFQVVLGLYLVLTISYSFRFKSVVLLDVIVLGLLYTMRIVAGIYAAHVSISYWILVFSMFLFVSLAMLKRFSELYNLRERNEVKVLGRGYIADDLPLASALGVAAGYISVLIIMLYIHDPVSLEKYSRPDWLWLVFPALLYWVSRMWLIAHRGQLNEDPVLYAIRDKPSYLVGAICLSAFMLAV